MPTYAGFALSLLAVVAVEAENAGGATVSFEDVLASIHQQVQQRYPNITGLSLIEALACRNQNCAKGNASMAGPEDATFMRAVFTQPLSTAPNVFAFINLQTSPPTTRFEYHTGLFEGDNHGKGFPPPSQMTFEAAWSKLKSAVPGADVIEVTWRRPLGPCVSEDLYQFVLEREVPGHGSVVSIGTETNKACYGQATRLLPIKLCLKEKPDCIDSAAAMTNVLV